jgi:alkanesulfonate monooxygenase
MVEFFWRIPTRGDGRSVPMAGWNRGDWPGAASQLKGARLAGRDGGASYADYLVQVAAAAEIAGFDGALIPSDITSDEPWLIAAAIARETRRLRLMPAFQPGFIQPAYAAKMAATLQRISNGRLEWNIITGGSAPAQLAYGDMLPHDQRYERTGEFLDVVAGLWNGTPFDYEGKHYQIRDGGLTAPLLNERRPGIYFSGASDAALAVAARHADHYLMWLEPLDAVRRSITRLDGLAAAHGRRPRYGIRVDLFARETEAEAWAEVRRLFDAVPAGIAAVSSHKTSSKGGDSVGANRQAALRPAEASRFEDYIIGPNLWAGLGLVRAGPTVGIVGDYAQVAARLNDYIAAGIDHFILAANPHLEEAYRIGEMVLPLVRDARATTLAQAAE